MAFETPLVATTAGGTGELVRNGVMTPCRPEIHRFWHTSNTPSPTRKRGPLERCAGRRIEQIVIRRAPTGTETIYEELVRPRGRQERGVRSVA